jgi:hypothetical protein
LLGRTGAGTGNAPNGARIGAFRLDGTTANVTFPCNYEIFAFSNEIYMVVNYDLTKYQWLAFGISTIDLPGTGLWFGGTRGNGTINTGVSNNIQMTPTSGGVFTTFGGTLFVGFPPSLFHYTDGSLDLARNSFVNHGFDSTDWFWQSSGGSSSSVPYGTRTIAPLYQVNPSTFNSESPLLPIRSYVLRPSNLLSLAVDCQNARLVRIDYYDSGQTITVGSDQWKVFPWFQKNGDVRNASTGFNNVLNHTGTLGWAIRYVPA